MENLMQISAAGVLVMINNERIFFDKIDEASILSQCQAISDLLRAKPSLSGELDKEVGNTIERINLDTIKKLEKYYSLNSSNMIIEFIEEDGGWCGSVGNPPIALPVKEGWLKRSDSDIYSGIGGDILKQYDIDKETADFIKTAIDRKVDIQKIFLEPAAVSEEFDIPVSENVQSKLKFVKERAEKIDEIDKEIIEFVNRIIVDGRFIGRWVIEPEKVSREIGMHLSDNAIERILAAPNLRISDIVRPGIEGKMSPNVVAAIVITAGITTYSSYKYNQPQVLDTSGVQKF